MWNYPKSRLVRQIHTCWRLISFEYWELNFWCQWKRIWDNLLSSFPYLCQLFFDNNKGQDFMTFWCLFLFKFVSTVLLVPSSESWQRLKPEFSPQVSEYFSAQSVALCPGRVASLSCQLCPITEVVLPPLIYWSLKQARDSSIQRDARTNNGGAKRAREFIIFYFFLKLWFFCL